MYNLIINMTITLHNIDQKNVSYLFQDSHPPWFPGLFTTAETKLAPQRIAWSMGFPKRRPASSDLELIVRLGSVSACLTTLWVRYTVTDPVIKADGMTTSWADAEQITEKHGAYTTSKKKLEPTLSGALEPKSVSGGRRVTNC